MCESCGFQDYIEDMKEAIATGMQSQFVESVLEQAERGRHISEKQKAGVDRWLDNWRERRNRGD